MGHILYYRVIGCSTIIPHPQHLKKDKIQFLNLFVYLILNQFHRQQNDELQIKIDDNLHMARDLTVIKTEEARIKSV